MARVRIFLCTYRRPHLLRRALASLLAQTFADWVCELHNDAPGDDAPRVVLAELAPGDARFSYHPHERNLGPVATFNLCHTPTPEPFFSILEDDNWWEATFLARMLTALAEHPEAGLAWANMKLWQEMADGGWRDTQGTIWPSSRQRPVTVAWPQLLQFDGPLHSNGAMLARAVTDDTLQLPAETPFDAMENLRERAFRYPLVLVPEPLANFALTLQTSRSGQLAPWVQAQTLMGAAFLRHVPLNHAEQAALWAARREASPPATSGLFFAAWHQPTPGFLRHSTLGDWWRLIRGCLRRPLVTWAVLRARQLRPQLWQQFDRATAAACARPQTTADIPPRRLACRVDLAGEQIT